MRGFNATPFLSMQNSTVSANRADDHGGGIFVTDTDALLRHVTITGNHANNDDALSDPVPSGEIDVVLDNTIIAGNFLGSTTDDPDDVGIPVNLGSRNNIIGDPDSAGGLRDGENGNIVGIRGTRVLNINSVLDRTLDFNGGPTRTHELDCRDCT